MTVSISNSQHNNALPSAESRYAECRVFTIRLSVVAPWESLFYKRQPCLKVLGQEQTLKLF